jgi:two-component system response regulator ResD
MEKCEMEKLKILVVDDEFNMRNLLKIYLLKNGYQVIEASSGKEAIRLFEEKPVDLIILDIMMPDMDGWQVCEEVRKKANVPILMLTARIETKDKVKGFNLGADDYLTKPFEPEELMVRVFALLRRAVQNQQHTEPKLEQIQYHGLTISPEGREVMVNEKKVDLTQKEFDVLYSLANSPKRAFSRETLLEQLWGHDYIGETRSVDTHVKNVREKIQKAGLSFNPILTVWGVGYKLGEPGDKR